MFLKNNKKYYFVVILVLSFIIPFSLYFIWTYESKLKQAITVNIPFNTPKTLVYKSVSDLKIIENQLVFRVLDYIFGENKSFLAGEYEFIDTISMKAVAKKLRSSDVKMYDMVIPEGLTVKQIINKINADDILSGDIDKYPEEGSLFPDVYKYYRGASRQVLLKTMQVRMEQELTTLWKTKTKLFTLKSKKEWVILSSIVERETGRSGERSLIASVFFNRLRLGYRLQSDPTVIYQISDGLGVIDRPLTTSDLKKQGAYNTYLHYGLPVKAIANPGRASLQAVIDPPKTKLLYFVADGEGGHRFAKSLKEHVKNVRLYRKSK